MFGFRLFGVSAVTVRKEEFKREIKKAPKQFVKKKTRSSPVTVESRIMLALITTQTTIPKRKYTGNISYLRRTKNRTVPHQTLRPCNIWPILDKLDFSDIF